MKTEFIDSVFVKRYDFFWARDYTKLARSAFFCLECYCCAFHNKFSFLSYFIFILIFLFKIKIIF